MVLTEQSAELLNADKIKLAIEPENQCLLSVLDIFDSIHSTNDYLLEYAKSNAPSGAVCFAEEQTRGRGRLGRSWYSPQGANIYCSLLWHFPVGTAYLSALSLAVAVIVVRALRKCGIQGGLQLKWPNDVLFAERKLAGILLETLPPEDGLISVVIGVGLNFKLPVDNPHLEAASWIDMSEIMGASLSRNYLAGLLVNELLAKLSAFQKQGLKAFMDEWCQYDVLKDKEVIVQTSSKKELGVVQGITPSGELLLKTKQGVELRFPCGEVSVQI